MDPLELRRKNFIPTEEFPLRDRARRSSTTRATTTARSTSCSSTSTSTAFRREQASLREQGIHRGVGFSTYVEMCGLAPSRAVGPAGRRPAGRRSGSRRTCACTPPASATVYTGTSPHGQGLETSFAQIVGRPARHRPAERRRDPRRHRTRARGAGTPTARARWRSAARRSRARPRRCRTRPSAIVRAPARGRARGHRARRRQVPGAGLARQGDDDGRDRRRGLHPAEDLPEGMEPGLEEIVVLRPGELRVPVRRARVRGRGGPGDRQGRRSSATSRSTTAARRSTRC